MDPSKLIPQMGDWSRILSKVIDTDEFNTIYRELKSRKGKIRTAPFASDLWKSLKLCQPDNLKVIIVGHSPYSMFKKDDPVADGLLLSCGKTKVVSLELENVYHAWETEYNYELDPDMDKIPDLSYLATQGVLLWHIALTVKEQRDGSDIQMWEWFNKMFWETINETYSGIPIVLLGPAAHKIEQYLTPMRHYVFKLSYPSTTTIWETHGTFRKIDQILWQNNGTGIVWYRKKNWDKDLPPWVTEKVNEDDIVGDMPWQKKKLT